MIRGATGDTVSVPLVRVTLLSDLCSGDFFCGLATSLPSGIDMLIGNDLCPSLSADVAVVTRSFDDDDDDDDDGRINFNVAYSPKTARTRNS